MKKNKRAYKLSPAAIAQRRAASKIAGEKRRKGPRKSVSLRADAADILRDAAKNRGLSKSEVIRRDVKTGKKIAMPIRPEMKARYPADWKKRSFFVREKRAKNAE
jgi:hypothetical protein